MAVTYRTLLNRVLRVLGEDEISDASSELETDYTKLVGSFLNMIKEEVEDAHNWRSLRTVTSATIPANTSFGSLTGTNERSRVVRISDSRYQRGGATALVFDTTDNPDPSPLVELPLGELLYRLQLDPDLRATDDVGFFAVDDSSGDELVLRVYPTPSTERTITAHVIVPQARFDDDALDTAITIPVRPVEVGTLWYALEERGEELGINALFSEERFRKALDDSIARDDAEQGGTELILS